MEKPTGRCSSEQVRWTVPVIAGLMIDAPKAMQASATTTREKLGAFQTPA